ncbi:MAG: hypothetical protein ACHQXK_09440 [Methanosarcina thermophila]|jgi:hypothetical protein|uniref:Uncharacterized protein n=5 Tax=Methanosarcina TaxID=2207 RepID=A0A1I6ZUE4_METTE|nr:hypothetical protein [Methanosarcina thermophila]ALK06048.1 MAG: hypothetical protein AAY43_10540 [Methanosarcina sp. 795]AYK16121.1 hypothetical protein AOB57_013805 [Methanosarcina flavescens]AKB12366.1 hypothetical protein MSTHT_0608 [Methanosarcina thermophila TM-1]AKB14430.1 hypothetical protein MSTHC_0112 [Methanosarcina thermophila CHTI-55]NLK32269.1 hypothetical protein [Methanosarcina flavescens]
MHEGHGGMMKEIWEILPADQKKEIALMKMDMKILWLEAKIAEMEKMIELKRKAIENTKKVQAALRK